MQIVSYGKVILKSSESKDVSIEGYYKFFEKKLSVYVNMTNSNTPFPSITISEVKNGKFTLISPIDCEVNWVVVGHTDNDIKDFMSWHPIF